MGHGADEHDAMTFGLCALLAQNNHCFYPWGKMATVTWAMKSPRKSLILVRLAGIEPTTLGFGGRYSIH